MEHPENARGNDWRIVVRKLVMIEVSAVSLIALALVSATLSRLQLPFRCRGRDRKRGCV